MTDDKIKPPVAVVIATIVGLAAVVAGIWLRPRLFDRHPASPTPNVTTNLIMLSVWAMPDCGTGRAKNVSTVEFFEGQLGTALVAGAPTDIRIDGTAATRTTFSDVRAHYVVVGVPSLQVSVELGAPTAAGAEQLAATLRITAGDADGCPSRAQGSHDLTALAPAVRAGADRSLLPVGATTVTLCRYQDGWLEQGATLPVPKLASFVAGANALPAGLSKAPDRQGKTCRSGADESENLTAQSAQDSASYLLFADYPSGPPVTVVVRLALCGKLGASNGSRTAQRTSELIALVTDLAGDSQGYPQAVTPA